MPSPADDIDAWLASLDYCPTCNAPADAVAVPDDFTRVCPAGHVWLVDQVAADLREPSPDRPAIVYAELRTAWADLRRAWNEMIARLRARP